MIFPDLTNIIRNSLPGGRETSSYVDLVIRDTEGIVSLFLTLSGCSSYTSFGAAIYMYLLTKCEKSVCGTIRDYILDMIPLVNQDGKEDSSIPPWIQFLRDVREDWTIAANHVWFNHLSRMLGIFVTIGMCDASSLTFSLGNYKVVEPDMQIIHKKAPSLMSAILDTSLFFIESLYMCFSTRSVKPLLYSSSEAQKLDEEFALITTWWKLVENGNLYKVTSAQGDGIDDNTFSQRLDALRSKTAAIRDSMSNSFEKTAVEKRLGELMKITSEYVLLKVSSGIRMAPITFLFHGSTGMGKTTVSEQLITACLSSQNLKCDTAYRCRKNASEKFWPGAKTTTNVFLLDDLCNTRVERTFEDPLRDVLDIDNNQPFSPPMAGLEEKGKVFCEPDVLCATTNVKDLNAAFYSVCPGSIQRRFSYTIGVKVREEFMENKSLSSSRVNRWRRNQETTPAFDDAWLITVETPVKPSNDTDLCDYRPYVYRGRELRDVTFSEALPFFLEEFAKHREFQRELVESVKTRGDRMFRCEAEGCIHFKGYCPYHDSTNICMTVRETVENSRRYGFVPNQARNKHKLRNQMGLEAMNAWESAYHLAEKKVKAEFASMDKTAGLAILAIAKVFVARFGFLCFVPSGVLQLRVVQDFILACNYRNIRSDMFFATFSYWFHFLAVVFLSHYPGMTFLYFVLLIFVLIFRFLHVFFTSIRSHKRNLVCCLSNCVYFGLTSLIILSKDWWSFYVVAILYFNCVRQCFLLSSLKHHYIQTVVERNHVGVLWTAYRDSCVEHLLAGCAVVGAIYALAKLHKSLGVGFGIFGKKSSETTKLPQLTNQGGLSPQSMEEADARNDEHDEYAHVIVRKNELTAVSNSSTMEGLRNNIERNLCYGTAMINGEKRSVVVLALCTQIFVVPAHYFDMCESDEFVATLRRNEPDKMGGTFKARFSRAHSWQKPGHDIMICHNASGFTFRCLKLFLPLKDVSNVDGCMLWRTKEGVVRTMNYAWTSGPVCKSDGLYASGLANLSSPPFEGLCGSPLITSSKSCIAGFHVAGNATQGAFVTITQSDFNDAMTYLAEIPTIVEMSNASKFRDMIMGYKVLNDNGLHYKSPVNFLPKGTQLAYLGSAGVQVKTVSKVKETPLRDVLVSCGYEDIYQAPAFSPRWEGGQVAMANMSFVGEQMEHSLLDASYGDYTRPILDVVGRLYSDARPLTEHENLNGVANKIFLDPMKRNTSVGFPLQGKKGDYMIEVEAEGETIRILNSALRQEIEFAESEWLEGRRMNYVAKGCKKDEIVTKRKCRIFYVNFISLVYSVRKYYLPMARILMLNPLLSECAVGINAHGPAWQELDNHIFKHGANNLICGDYGKYDQKIPSQLIEVAFKVLIDMAKLCNYSENDLNVMRGMISDIVYSYISLDGDLLCLQEGGHISGNPLTVIINGIVGSINLRCSFFNLVGVDTSLNFRDIASIITYGDDLAGSVDSSKVPGYNIKYISKFLDDRGQIFTMPNKEDPLQDFLPPDDFEFLKRSSNHIPEIGRAIGALNEKSIQKMLMYFVRDAHCEDSEELATAKNVDTALREWFNHGREKYEFRRKQMREVTDLIGISFMCTMLDKDFDYLVENWKDKYKDLVSRYDSPVLAVDEVPDKEHSLVFDEDALETSS